jgi:hypothetical protein
VDGQPVPGTAFPLLDDRLEHEVEFKVR